MEEPSQAQRILLSIRMRRRRKKWIVIGIIIALIAGGAFAVHEKNYLEMKQIVHSAEADKAFRDSLQGYDPRAFTKLGVIHSYVIDDKSISHNPMGGIDLFLQINGYPDLNVQCSLDRENGTGPLEDTGGGESIKLMHLLDANAKKHPTTESVFKGTGIRVAPAGAARPFFTPMNPEFRSGRAVSLAETIGITAIADTNGMKSVSDD